jgi:5'-3' exonuclease
MLYRVSNREENIQVRQLRAFSVITRLTARKRYVHYAMQRVRLLRHYGIHPYIVFDGGNLPAKRGTEEERRRRRTENLACANALAAKGKHSQARDYYSKCVDVTPEMTFQLIKVCGSNLTR